MGFWQHLADSYEQNFDVLGEMYPLSTTSISNNSDIIAVIVIDGNGNFLRHDKIAKKTNPTKKSAGNPLVNITIPASQESLKRTSTAILPYPVFEEFSYLKSIPSMSEKRIKKLYRHNDSVSEHIKKLKANKRTDRSRLGRWKTYSEKIKKLERYGKKYDTYIDQLKAFSESDFATAQVKAIYKYIAKRTVASDLVEVKLKDKTNIVFRVEIPGNSQTEVWEDSSFFSAWHQYYVSEKTVLVEKKEQAKEELSSEKKLLPAEKNRLKELVKLKDKISLDYVTGVTQLTATSHPKKISNASGNSKLISDNDTNNYTFRGKFTDSSEAVTIGYETSQKAHQFLRYLINDRGYVCGEQVILSYTIGNIEKLLPPPINDTSISEFLQDSITKTESDKQIDLRAETGLDYAEALKKALGGFGHNQTLKQHAKTAVVALDAATTGRLSITFYRKLDKSEYLEKVADWHRSCKWNQAFWNKETQEFVPYIGAPTVDRIIEAVYGKPRGGKDESYTKIKKTARERLLRCVFDGAVLPMDYVTSAIRRASSPLGVKLNGKFDRNSFARLLSTACALARKYYLDVKKEEYKLSIEFDRTDRAYLYGRLLGAADKLEEYALFKKKNERIVTAAIRHMQAFSQRPFRTWQTIHNCLNPYIQSVKGGLTFQEIEEIKNKFISVDEFTSDTPLDGSYLIGYYHERAHIDSLVKNLSDKKISTKTNEQEDNDGGQ